jgi:hypothetical protein
MSRRQKEPPPPLYPLHAQHAESLTTALDAAGNLLSACETLLQLEGALNPKIADVLRPRADALKLALFGKTIQ